MLTSNKSAAAPNKGVVIVNVHRDTRNAGETDDTPILEVIVTPVENWDISEDCAREQFREHVRASSYSGNIQQSRTLGENARAVENYPTIKHIVAYQQGSHVQCDL